MSLASVNAELKQLVHEPTGANAESIDVPVAGGPIGSMSLPIGKSALDKLTKAAGTELEGTKGGKGDTTVSEAFAGAALKQLVQELTGANVKSTHVLVAGGPAGTRRFPLLPKVPACESALSSRCRLLVRCSRIQRAATAALLGRRPLPVRSLSRVCTRRLMRTLSPSRLQSHAAMLAPGVCFRFRR